jgi:serine/threonine-protein kinase
VLLEEGHALVADFGVAKALAAAADAHTLTSVGVALGTPAYMAPEQAAADPATDHRADLYAFGVVAYELLAGRAPFAHRAPHAQLAAHAAEVPEPVTAHRPRVPADLAALVMRCLEKRPADRPQSAEELLAVLDAAHTPSAGMLAAGGPARTGSRPLLRLRRRAVMAVALALALAGAGAGATLYARRGPDPRRIAVAVFENQTGDPALDPLGRMAADWITQGLTQTHVLDVVHSAATFYAAPGEGPAGARGGTDRVRALAAATGAGTVVWGTYYRQGDSVRLQAQVTDARRGTLLRAIEPVSGPAQRPMDAVERLRQRVTAGLATMFDQRLAAMATNMIEPPSVESYREFVLGLELFYRTQYPEAIAHFARAAALDSSQSRSTGNAALLWVAVAYANQNRYAQADSMVGMLASQRERLSAADQAWLGWVAAGIQGDRGERLRLTRRLEELSPGNPLVALLHGFAAVEANRPREALEAFRRIDARGPMGEWPAYWQRYTRAHHMLGAHDQELALARRARERFPTNATLFCEVRALAALGRVGEVGRRLEASVTEPAHPAVRTTAADVMLAAAFDLRAHGHPAAARAAAERAIRWHLARPAAERTSEATRAALARALYVAGRWDEARAHFEALARAQPDNVDYAGHLGALAARRGDRREAVRIAAQLEASTTPYLRGRHTRGRAAIAALLGEDERAVALLRDALAQGYDYHAVTPVLHVDVDLESLRSYPPFQELLRPRG